MCEPGRTHMNTETKTKHKRYDEAFKKSAVEHWLISGKSAWQIAAELGWPCLDCQTTSTRHGLLVRHDEDGDEQQHENGPCQRHAEVRHPPQIGQRGDGTEVERARRHLG